MTSNLPATGDDNAKFAAPRLPWHPMIEQRFGEIGATKASWKALTEAVYPNAQTADSIVMALSYCAARKLDPFKRPVHIVPMWDSNRRQMVETVWPGISEIRTTAFRTGQYAGCDEVEFGPMISRTFTGKVGKKGYETEKTIEVTFPEWGRINVYRNLNGQRCKFVSPKVYWLESYGRLGASDVPNDMWAKRPSGQLEKCVEAAGLRKAFPEEVGNDYSAEEMHGQVLAGDVASVPRIEAPEPIKPPAPSKPAEIAKPAEKVEDAQIIDPEVAAEQEAFEADAWLMQDVEPVFAGCKTEQNVDEAHAMFEDTVDTMLSIEGRRRYQELHEAALTRVTDAARAEQLRPQEPAPPATAEKPAPAAASSLDDDEDETKVIDKGDLYVARGDAVLQDPARTRASIAEFWVRTKDERLALKKAGHLSAEAATALNARLKAVDAELAAAEQADDDEEAPEPAAPPAGDDPIAKFDQEYRAKIASIPSVTELHQYVESTLKQRNELANGDQSLITKWREVKIARQNQLNGIA